MVDVFLNFIFYFGLTIIFFFLVILLKPLQIVLGIIIGIILNVLFTILDLLKIVDKQKILLWSKTQLSKIESKQKS